MSTMSITLPNHPLLSILGLDNLTGCSETLDFCSDHLQLLNDLFGDTNEAYAALDSDAARRAMFRTLLDMALMLKAVSKALLLQADADNARVERIERRLDLADPAH